MTLRSKAMGAAAVLVGVAGLAAPASAAPAGATPSITAHVSSAHPRSSYGWYRSPVTVRFTCTSTATTPLRPCPKPVTLTKNGANQKVSGVVGAKDHSSEYRVTVRNIDIDRTAPTARVVGVVPGKRYFNATPGWSCAGSDALSGIATCRTLVGLAYRQTVIHPSVVVSDRAGNVTRKSVTVYNDIATIDGADYNLDKNLYGVKLGHTYVLDVTSTLQPRYIDAAAYDKTPSGDDLYLARTGTDTWKLKVTINNAMRARAFWNLGIEIAGVVHPIKVHVTT